MDDLVATATAGFLDTLHDNERATAHVYLQKAAQAADEAWEQMVPVAEVERTDPAPQENEDAQEVTFAPARRGRLDAPQLQARLSQLSDRTRLRRLRDTLQAEGAWQQVARIEDLCHTHVSLRSDSVTWSRVRVSVLAPHDFVVNVQKNDQAIGATQERVGVVCLEHSWIRRWNMERSAALPKPRKTTTRVYTQCSEA